MKALKTVFGTVSHFVIAATLTSMFYLGSALSAMGMVEMFNANGFELVKIVALPFLFLISLIFLIVGIAVTALQLDDLRGWIRYRSGMNQNG